jgi:hypothetical protein
VNSHRDFRLVPATRADHDYHRAPQKQAPEGRRCVEHGCDTILSRYNTHDECSVHESRRPYHMRGTKRP